MPKSLQSLRNHTIKNLSCITDWRHDLHSQHRAFHRHDQQRRGRFIVHDRRIRQYAMAQLVRLLLINPLRVHHCTGDEGTCHVAEVRPVGSSPQAASGLNRRTGDCTPELGPSAGGIVEGVSEGCQEVHRPAEALAVYEDQRQHASVRNVTKARVAQDLLAERLAQDLQFLHQQDEDGQGRHSASPSSCGSPRFDLQSA